MKNFLFIALFLFGTISGFAQSKVAHLNSQEVMAGMSSYNTAVKKLEAYQVEMKTEFRAMILDYQEAAQILEGKMDELSPVILEIEKDKLTKKEQRISEREQTIQQDIEAYSRELNLPIIAMMEEAVKIVSDRNKYDYVFDISVVMIYNGPDMTQEVIKEILILESKGTQPPQEDIRP